MKFAATLTSLAVLSATLISSVSATACYSSGRYATPYDMDKYSKLACRGTVTGKDGFRGVFKAGEKKKVCMNVSDPYHIDHHIYMELENREDHSRDISDDGCIREFAKIIKDCTFSSEGRDVSRGGVNAAPAKWWFRIDPQQWEC